MTISRKIYDMTEKHIDKTMHLASLNLRVKNIKGHTVEYWDNEQDKPTIVLIHGFGATAKYQWFKQVEMLSKHYRIVMPNLFHFGNSKPSIELFDLDAQIEHVHDLLVDLGITIYTVCGVSYGGIIGLEIAHKYKSEVNKVVVFDTPAKYLQRSDIDAICRRFNVENIEELFAPANAGGMKKLMYLASGKKSLLPAFIFKEFYKEMYGANLKNKRKLIKATLGRMEEYSAHEYVIDVPILLIWGSNDGVVPLARGQQLKEYLGDSCSLHVIKNGAHMPNMNKTKEFNRIVEAFLLRGTF